MNSFNLSISSCSRRRGFRFLLVASISIGKCGREGVSNGGINNADSSYGNSIIIMETGTETWLYRLIVWVAVPFLLEWAVLLEYFARYKGRLDKKSGKRRVDGSGALENWDLMWTQYKEMRADQRKKGFCTKGMFKKAWLIDSKEWREISNLQRKYVIITSWLQRGTAFMPEAVNVSWKEAVGFSSTLLASLSRHKVWTLHTKVCLVSYHFLSRFWYIIYLFFKKKIWFIDPFISQLQ